MRINKIVGCLKMTYNGLAVWFCKPTTPLQATDKLSKAYKIYRLLAFHFLCGGKIKIEIV